MFDAQLLIRPAEDLAIFSPWFPRGGDTGAFTLEVVAISGATITVSVFTKSSETVGDGSNANAGVSLSLTAVNRDTDVWTGTLNELVRYRYVVSGETGDWVLFRMLPPVWSDSVKG